MTQFRGRSVILMLAVLTFAAVGSPLRARAQDGDHRQDHPRPASPLNIDAVHVLAAHGSDAERQVEAARQAGGFGTRNLVNHGGPVMTKVTNYAIFWNPGGSPTDTEKFDSHGDAGYEQTIENYLSDAGRTNFSDIVTQYSSASGAFTNGAPTAVVDVAAALSGATGSSSNPLQDSDIQAEIIKVMSAQGWTAGPSNIFFVFTPLNVYSCDAGYCSFTYFCAYHGPSTSTFNGQTFLYANMPDAGTLLNGNSGPCWSGEPTPGDLDAYATINVTSHEQMETVTDPNLDAWYDSSGEEIGDKCAWNFGTITNNADVTLNGSSATVQKEWSNADTGCALANVSPSKSTVSASSTNLQKGKSSTITVTLNDTNGQPVSGVAVGLTAGARTHATITTVSGVTSGGVATFTVTDNTTESVTFTATDTYDNVKLAQTVTVKW